MKHYIYILIASLFSFIQVQAQSTDDTHVEVKAGQELLENLLTDGQKQHITHLTVKGTLQEADYAYLRNTLFKQLEELNLRDADIDTIPAHAFDCEPEREKESFYAGIKVILPLCLKHVSDNSLLLKARETVFELTGSFPSLDTQALYYSDLTWGRVHIQSSDDNTKIKSELTKDKLGSILYSLDNKVLYSYDGRLELDINENTRIINKQACAGLGIYRTTIPEYIDSIGDEAFANTIAMITACIPCDEDPILYFKSKVPPKLGKNVFMNSEFIKNNFLYVPDESVELYQNAPGWKDLRLHIKGITQDIKKTEKDKEVSLTETNDDFIIKSTKNIQRIDFLGIGGELLFSKKENTKIISVSKTMVKQSHALLRVVLSNGKIKVFKFRL